MTDIEDNLADRKELEAIGQRIRICRKNLKVQQKVMAQKLGVSPSYFNEIELGRSIANGEILVRLAKTFNINANYLITGKGEQFTNTKRSKPAPKPEPIEDEFPIKGIDTVEKLLQLMEYSYYAKMSIFVFATKLLDEQENLIRKTKKDSSKSLD